MSAKPIVPREQARRDVIEAVEYYLVQGGESAALGLIDALESAYRVIASHPAAGSPRYAHELDLPSLRCWPVKPYPYLIFYVEREGRIDLWRVLHAHRDIPAWMKDAEDL